MANDEDSVPFAQSRSQLADFSFLTGHPAWRVRSDGRFDGGVGSINSHSGGCKPYRFVAVPIGPTDGRDADWLRRGRTVGRLAMLVGGFVAVLADRVGRALATVEKEGFGGNSADQANDCKQWICS
jgi:hypothetical protein